MHLTDDQLNEYLDTEIADRAQIELHLASCRECEARLAALRNLFAEIESLPDLTLSRNLATHFKRQSSPSYLLPRWLTLTTTLQAAVALIIIVFTAPLVLQLVSPYTSTLQTPSFADVFLLLQSQWTVWLNTISQVQIPTLPEIPVVELSSLMIVVVIIGISALWLIGNGLLLRNQVK